MTLYTADRLITLRRVDPPAGKPAWANLIADVDRAAAPAELCGPGLYALLLDGAQFYIGLHVGEQAGADCSVLHRWVLHVVGQTMRSRETSFSRRSLRRLLDTRSGDPVSEGLAACLPQGRDTDLAALPGHPLIRGAHCTAQKAVFAARHWDVFAPGNEDAMLSRITCLFQPVAADWAGRLDGAEGRERGAWAREVWLRPAETALADRFRPICNAATPIGTQRDGVGLDEVAAAMAAALPRVLPVFDRADDAAPANARRPAPASVVEAYAERAEPSDSAAAMLADEEGLSIAEQNFRRPLSDAGDRFVDTLRDTAPGNIELYFTDTPDLRLRVAGTRRPLVRLTTAHGSLCCATRLAPEACRRLGFADMWLRESDPMRTQFLFDPAATAPGAILDLVGANRLR
ncbi:hypothetical protein [Sphingomonas yantingensis]|uniref:Uncharacterized protein n=1 Tax=Sphingomonas yantingensis TaxID=1241761 RepID=A0A7W9AT57_9SPHN|nr:hypothetical protein [Sphingomonas yantingensis]MBB5700133.1 hypothetical protein [Sphingomonas yantingensis]